MCDSHKQVYQQGKVFLPFYLTSLVQLSSHPRWAFASPKNGLRYVGDSKDIFTKIVLLMFLYSFMLVFEVYLLGRM